MTMRPKRSGVTDNDDFQDPLKNYDSPDYADELERVLAEGTLAAMKCTPFSAVAPDSSIESAMQVMVQQNIACIAVVDEENRLLGIFSERDVLNRVADEYEQIKHRPVHEVMTPNPMAAHETESPAKTLNLMATCGFRHVPILDVDDKLVGIVGPRRVINFIKAYL